MAIVVDPIDASGGAPAYSAQQLRQARGALAGWASSARPLGARSGVRPGTPATSVFLTGTGSTTWNLAAISGILDTETPVNAGPYQFATDGADTGTLTAADGANPRVDSIFVSVNDTVQDGSGQRGGAVTYTAGLPGTAGGARGAAGGPPNIPARAIEIAQINVPASGSGAPTVSWVAPYCVAAGGIVPVSGPAVYPANPYTGLHLDDAALGGLMRYNGSGWVQDGVPLIGVAAPLTGSSTPPIVGSAFKMQAGPVTVTTNSSAVGTFPWPVAFPNGVISVVLTTLNDTYPELRVVQGSTATTPTQCQFVARNNVGTAAASVGISLCFIAIGW